MIFLRLLTVDETWTHYYEPEHKAHSRQWVGPGSPKPQKCYYVRLFYPREVQ